MSLTPDLQIYLYWAIGLLMGFLVLRDELMSFNQTFDKRRIWLIIAMAAVVLFNMVIYSNSTTYGTRTLDPLTLIVFSIGNGIAETLIFFSFFKLAETLVGKVVQKPWVLFLTGLFVFMIYSGLIHGLFWIEILPEHIVDTPENAIYRSFFMPTQIMLALGWSLCFFWYRDLYSIFLFHGLVDATMVYCVRFSFFPPVFS